MASAVPYAIGAQCAYPGGQVVAFTGDGSAAMLMGEFATLAQHDLPVKVVVMRNNSLTPEVWEQNAYLGTPQFGCELSTIEFAKVAEACGIKGVRIDEPASCRDALQDGLAHDGPALIECAVDPYESPITETLKPRQAEHIATALKRGEKARDRIAKSLLEKETLPFSPGVRAAKDRLSKN